MAFHYRYFASQRGKHKGIARQAARDVQYSGPVLPLYPHGARQRLIFPTAVHPPVAQPACQEIDEHRAGRLRPGQMKFDPVVVAKGRADQRVFLDRSACVRQSGSRGKRTGSGLQRRIDGDDRNESHAAQRSGSRCFMQRHGQAVNGKACKRSPRAGGL